MNKRRYILLFMLFFCTVLKAESFKVGFANSLQKLRGDRTAVKDVVYKDSVYLDMARDESESFQLVVVPQNSELKNIKVNLNPVIMGDDKLKTRWHIVDYVKTSNPSYPTPYVGLWPDVLMPAANFDVAADEVQPLWFSVISDPQTPAGVYNGSIEISDGKTTEIVELVVNVRNFTIPRPGTLATPFGLYKWTLEEWYYGKRDTLAKEDFMRWCEFLAEYRLTVKNIGYEYVEKKYADVDGEKKLVGVDMSKLNPELKRLSNEYFAPYSYGLYRLQSGPTVEKGMEAQASWCTPENIAAPVKLHFDQWQKQGFNDEVYIYGVDEATNGDMYELIKDTYALIKKDIPNSKIMQTGLCNKPEMVGLIDIWCPKNEIAWAPFFQERLKAGDTLWMYVCCSPVPPYPNLLVDEPAVHHRVLFWQTRQIGATGFLYWSTLWHSGIEAKPYTDKPAFPERIWDYGESNMYSDVWVHVNGDGLLVYPGKNLTPLPSIRLEIVRDGIEDYEYMVILEKLVAEVSALEKYQTKGTASLIARAKELSQVPDFISSSALKYTEEPQVLFERRREIADMIEQFKDILENKDYTNWKM